MLHALDGALDFHRRPAQRKIRQFHNRRLPRNPGARSNVAPLRHYTVDNQRMVLPEADPNIKSADLLVTGVEDGEHDHDLVEWLASKGVRSPDWSIDPCILDRWDRQSTGETNPIKLPGQSMVSGVYLFYSRTSIWITKGDDENRIIPLYVGKAVNLWNRMQNHWCRPEVGGWVDSYLKEIENGSLDEIVMACAWVEEERAAVEAHLIKTLKPMFCRRTE